MSATINIAGTASGVNTLSGVKGKTAQYQLGGTNSGSSIKGYDSGNIKTVGAPGKTPAKATDGTIQRSTDPLIVSQSGQDNFVANTTGQGQGIPTVNAAFTPSAGKSLAPEHE